MRKRKGRGKKEGKCQLIIIKTMGRAVVVPLVCGSVFDCVLHKQRLNVTVNNHYLAQRAHAFKSRSAFKRCFQR